MIFWGVALGVSVLAAAVIALAMLRGSAAGDESADLAIYRDQLAEVERDMARGVLDADEAERARAEVARRLLAADRAGAAAAGRAPRRLTLVGAALVGLVTVAGAAALYIEIGAPGYRDLPLAKRLAESEALRQNRPSQAEAEAAAGPDSPEVPPAADANFLRLMERLREAIAERPDDIRGLTLLATNEAALGNYVAAARAQEQLLSVVATPTAAQYGDLVEYYVSAAAGYVSPEAEAAVARALEIDPLDPRARYFAGYYYFQVGRPDIAFNFWRRLLEEGPEDAPWIAPIRAQIMPLAQLAGAANYTPPPPVAAAPLRGPTADDMAAASEMSDEDRAAMIQGMVDGLAERLATEGGPAAEWARLINALGVLGQAERAAAIWAEAQQVFAAAPADLAEIRSAAERAGVASE